MKRTCHANDTAATTTRFPGLAVAALCVWLFLCPRARAQTMWCLADLNQDHQVAMADLSLMLMFWGDNTPSNPADIDRNGEVDGGDMALLLLEFGSCAPEITSNTAYALCQYIDTLSSPTPYPLEEGWRVVWKPDVSVGSCYAMVLQATPTEDAFSGEFRPIYALAIQGTQNSFDATLDMEVTPQVPFTPIEGANISQGSSDALECVLNLVQTTNGQAQTLLDFFNTLDQDDRLFVTGHSLGGNITSVITPWLAANVPAFTEVMSTVTRLPENLCAMSFAAPTAGNTAFAAFLNANPTGYQAFFNSNDVVPNAWSISGPLNLNRINNLYLPTAIPSSVSLLLQSKKLEMHNAGVAYAQTNGVTFTFPLATPPDGTTDPWLWQVGYQHNNAYCAQFLGSSECAAPTH